MTIERINHLFESGTITAQEHNELILLYVNESKKSNSFFGYLTLILALFGYILMLSFTKDNNEFSVLSSGNQRLWAGGIFSIISIAAFVISNQINRAKKTSNNFAYVGLGIAIAILFIVIPVFFMSI
jgi:hypothetical protein